MPPDLTIEAREDADVSQTVALSAAVRRLAASRLLHARLNWDKLFSSAEPHFERGAGAPSPEYARASLTRQAIRDTKARRSAARANASAGHSRAFQQLLKACA